MFDICIVGAGMAGMTAAIEASRLGLSVVLIEKNKKIGNKIYATGNGKCNLSNSYMDYSSCFHSCCVNYSNFIKDVFSSETYTDILNEYFKYIGLKTYTDKNGYIYPTSNQASSVVWLMNDCLISNDVKILTNTTVEHISKTDNIYSIYLNDSSVLHSKYVILACGGNSYSKLGGSLKGYELCKELGHHITPISPALCAVITNDGLCDAEGVRIKTTVNLLVDNKIEYSSTGEVQITSYGLSGIAIFNLASRINNARHNKKQVKISMNLLENNITDINELEMLCKYIKIRENRTIMCALNGITNEKTAQYTLKKNSIAPKTLTKDLSYKEIYKLLYDLYNYNCFIIDTKSYDMAQVTSGGVCLDEINSLTCESRKTNNLFIIGELLDIDGICGGYNLTFSILSAIKAANSIYAKNKSN